MPAWTQEQVLENNLSRQAVTPPRLWLPLRRSTTYIPVGGPDCCQLPQESLLD